MSAKPKAAFSWLPRRTASAAHAGTALVAAFTEDAVTLHTANGDVAFAGGAVAALFGTDAGTLNGTGLFARIHLADRPAFLTALARALNGSGAMAELRVRRGDDAEAASFRWLAVRARMRAKGEAVCTFSDIADRKQAEEDAETARADSTDRRLQRSLARAAETLSLALQSVHRGLALGSIDALSWRRASLDGLALLERCRLDVTRLRAALDAGASCGPGQTVGLRTALDRIAEDTVAELGVLRQVLCDCAPAIADAPILPEAGRAALRLLLGEALASALDTVKLSATREGDELVFRIRYNAAAAAGADVQSSALWLEIVRQVVGPAGASVAHERRGGEDRLVLRLHALGDREMSVIPLHAHARTGRLVARSIGR